jgi:transposase
MLNLHLKEYEFRFNNYKKNIYRVLLVTIRKESLQFALNLNINE